MRRSRIPGPERLGSGYWAGVAYISEAVEVILELAVDGPDVMHCSVGLIEG
jgi:hypothetical protein